MSFKINRQESLPNKHGKTFKVNDGVSYGFNGDSYPCTVRKVSDSGKQVLVSRDDHRVTKAELERSDAGYHEGSIGSVFIPQEVSDDELEVFKLDKFGRFHNKKTWTLSLGREYSQNPSF